jgi:transposase
VRALVVTVRSMSYPSDLTDDQWALLEPMFNAPGKRCRKYGADLRTVVEAMLHVVPTAGALVVPASTQRTGPAS